MKRFIAIGAFALTMSAAFAQNAYRCDVNGATVYSEKPCADGKAVAPTQDSDAQKQRAADANKQMKADDKALGQRIESREAREGKERAAIRKAAERERRAAEKRERAEKAAQAKKAKQAAKGKIKITKVKKQKPPKAAPSAKPT
jgi:Domain of unknown function (DUF4124)